MIAAFELLASDNAKGAFPLSRIRCRMDRAVEDGSHVDDVLDYGLREFLPCSVQRVSTAASPTQMIRRRRLRKYGSVAHKRAKAIPKYNGRFSLNATLFCYEVP